MKTKYQALGDLVEAVHDCLDRDHPQNQEVLQALRRPRRPHMPITVRIPASLWNKVKGAMEALEAHKEPKPRSLRLPLVSHER